MAGSERPISMNHRQLDLQAELRGRTLMAWIYGRLIALMVVASFAVGLFAVAQTQQGSRIGQEVSIPRHLQDDEEFSVPVKDLLDYGKKLFMANWTEQEGAGRPLMKGTGTALSDPAHPLVGMRAFNRISGPEANSCYGCHNQPFGIP